MIAPSLPQDRAALVDRAGLVTPPFYKWMNQMTRLALELQAAGTGTTTPTTDAPDLRIFGKDPIKVTGNATDGFSVSIQDGALTASDDVDGGNFTDTYTSMAGAIDGGAGFA